MPLYEYICCETGCSYCQNGFEIQQRLADPALEKCPQCQAPVRKAFSTVAFSKTSSRMLSRNNLEKNGFVRYEKSKDGTYVKTAGKQGPEVIKKQRA